ncbi:MAG: carbonic anhydrase [Archangium sp.]
MQKLIQGLHDFQRTVFAERRELFENLAKGQRPEVLFITCSDSRVVPNVITQTDPGDLFVIRNAGNIVAPHSGTPSAEAATVEYAVEVLKVKDIVLCGHSHCGAMKAVLDPSQASDLPAVRGWLGHADATGRIMRQNYTHLSGDALLTATVQENVLVQLDNLRTLPSVASGLASGKLRLHGWVYKIETGQVFGYDRDERQFLPLIEKSPAYEPAYERAAVSAA